MSLSPRQGRALLLLPLLPCQLSCGSPSAPAREVFAELKNTEYEKRCACHAPLSLDTDQSFGQLSAAPEHDCSRLAQLLCVYEGAPLVISTDSAVVATCTPDSSNQSTEWNRFWGYYNENTKSCPPRPKSCPRPPKVKLHFVCVDMEAMKKWEHHSFACCKTGCARARAAVSCLATEKNVSNGDW